MRKLLWAALSLVLTLGMGWLDYREDLGLSLSFFYLVPIGISAWLVGSSASLLICTLGTELWILTDLHSIRRGYHPVETAWNAATQLGFFLTVSLLLSGLRRALEREKALARVDPLTGAANGRAFEEAAQVELARARRDSHPLTLAYMDVDHFKRVNDEFGHKAGDALLRTVAQVVRAQIRSTDVFARIGGDEFVILMPQAGLAEARDRLEKVRSKLQEAARKPALPVTFSIGATTFLQTPASVDEMLKRADALMYTVKNGGRDRLAQEEHRG